MSFRSSSQSLSSKFAMTSSIFAKLCGISLLSFGFFAYSPSAEAADKAGSSASVTKFDDIKVQKGTFNPKSLPKELPKDFKVKGTVAGGAKWTDKNGINVIVVVTNIEDVPKDVAKDSDDTKRFTLSAFHFTTKDGKTQQLWKTLDFSDNPCDQGHGLVSEVYVEDLDNNGIAENGFVYNVEGSCDVSPITYKVMMHSDVTKYVVRGTSKVVISADGETVGGDVKADDVFDMGSPADFKIWAMDLWTKHVPQGK